MREFRCVGYIGITDVWNQAIFWWDDDKWTADFYLGKNDESYRMPLPVAWEIEPAFP